MGQVSGHVGRRLGRPLCRYAEEVRTGQHVWHASLRQRESAGDARCGQRQPGETPDRYQSDSSVASDVLLDRLDEGVPGPGQELVHGTRPRLKLVSAIEVRGIRSCVEGRAELGQLDVDLGCGHRQRDRHDGVVVW